METLLQDVRYGCRNLLKQPAFTFIAVLTLALGIGVNATIFSYVNAVLFRALTFREPERVVFIWSDGGDNSAQNLVSPLDYLDWRDGAQSFDGMAAATVTERALTGSGDPARISSARVTADFFKVLGINPVLGRALLPDDDRPGAANVVLLGHRFWQDRFGGDSNILGRTITLDDRTVTVVGIVPADFRFIVDGDIWEPLAVDPQREDRNLRSLVVFGRLKPAGTLLESDAEMKRVSARLAEQFPATNAGWSSHVQTAPDVLWGPQGKTAFVLLLGVVLAVLLIACANIAGLQFARGTARQRDIAVRQALGAGRWRVIRQLVTENLVLAAVGGALGLLATVWGMNLIEARYGASLAFLTEAVVDRRVLFYTMTLALLSGLVCGLAPALQSGTLELPRVLRAGLRSGSTDRGTRRFRNALVVGEVSVALVLLVATGLMIRTILAYQQIDPGFETHNLLTMRVALPERDYPGDQQRQAFFERALAQISAQPGVESAGAIARLPMTGSSRNSRRSIALEGRAVAANDKPYALDLVVTPGYFDALGIPLYEGRPLSTQDRADAPRVAVISLTMASKYWPQDEPLGKRFRFESSSGNEPWTTVVGVVGDVRNDDVDQPPLPQVYLPHTQNSIGDLSLVIRTNGAPLEQVSAIRRSIATLDQKLPIYDVASMDNLLFDDLAGVRVIVELLVAFSVLALLLAAIGVYGVMSYAVAQRAGEIGIRMALGAQAWDVLRLVVDQGAKLVLCGEVIGLVLAFLLAKGMSGLVYGVSSTDPLTFVSISILLAAVALLACYVPARLATNVDPLVALRHE